MESKARYTKENQQYCMTEISAIFYAITVKLPLEATCDLTPKWQ